MAQMDRKKIRILNRLCEEGFDTEDAIKTIVQEISTYDREVFGILNLRNNGQVINMNICSVGTLNAALVTGRETMKSAILSNASAFIAFHSHPSGNIHPSTEDLITTRKLVQAGEILDIRMMDHIIIGGGNGEWFSFKENGLMDDISRKARADIAER